MRFYGSFEQYEIAKPQTVSIFNSINHNFLELFRSIDGRTMIE